MRIIPVKPALTILTLLAFVAKTGFFVFVFIWVRWTLPRFRYDQVMELGWKIMLPLTLAITFITAAGIVLADVFSNQMYFWAIPVLSIAAGLFAVIMVYRDLRRKMYGRA